MQMIGSGRHVSSHELARLLGDWQEASSPIYKSLTRRLAQLLSDGRVAPGVRLPAERRLAEELGVSRTTIIRTYAALREQDLLESRRGAGSVTRLSPGSVERFTSWTAATRTGPSTGDVIDLTKAAPRADDQLVEVLQQAAAQAPTLLGHHGYYELGIGPLRNAVAQRYEQRGIPTTPEQILITAGAQQGIDLLVRSLVRHRDAVIIESPTYAGAMDSLRLAGARMVSLDISSHPWRLDALEILLKQTDARLAYLIPDFQNPTGQLMPDAAREELVLLCRRHGVTLLTDDTLAEVTIDPGPLPLPLAAHDASEAVISIGSMSKAVWGGLRVGWIRASPRQITALAAIRTTASLGGTPIEQIAAASILPELDEYLAERRPALAAQRDTLVHAVTRIGWQVTRPSGGLSAWVTLPQTSSSLLADVAYRHGVLLIPGPRLSPDGALDRFLRLPYSFPIPTLVTAIERLEIAWNEIRGRTGGDRHVQAV